MQPQNIDQDPALYQELKEIFDFFDKDQSGTIDASELVNILQCLGENPIEAEVQDMINALDKDGNGTIDWREFAEMMIQRRGNRDVDKEILEVFRLFDRDETGAITKEGVLFVMNKFFKENMTMEEAEDMVRVAGGSKGYVTLEEFKEIMLNGI